MIWSGSGLDLALFSGDQVPVSILGPLQLVLVVRYAVGVATVKPR